MNVSLNRQPNADHRIPALDPVPGLKASEIKKCAKCGKGVMHTGLPLFWRVKIERFGIDKAAVDRRQGLETFYGGGQPGAALAGVMGPDEDIARPVMDEKMLILCENCALDPYPVAGLAELEGK